MAQFPLFSEVLVFRFILELLALFSFNLDLFGSATYVFSYKYEYIFIQSVFKSYYFCVLVFLKFIRLNHMIAIFIYHFPFEFILIYMHVYNTTSELFEIKLQLWERWILGRPEDARFY